MNAASETDADAAAHGACTVLRTPDVLRLLSGITIDINVVTHGRSPVCTGAATLHL